MQELIKEFSEMKGELKYISKTLSKVEKVLENQGVMLEKQNVANKRIMNLESSNKEQNIKIRKLEDWQLKLLTIATIIATVGSTMVGIIIKKFV